MSISFCRPFSSAFFAFILFSFGLFGLFGLSGCGLLGSDNGDSDSSANSTSSATCTPIDEDFDLSASVTLDEPCYQWEGLLTQDSGQLTVAADTTIHFGPQAGLVVRGSMIIAPGARLEFEEDAGLHIDGGTLIANASGEGPSPIVFEGARDVSGYWKELHFSNTPGSASNELVHVIVRHGASQTWDPDRSVTQANIFVSEDGRLHLSHAQISDSGHHGISATGGQITGCDELSYSNIERHSAYSDDAAQVCF